MLRNFCWAPAGHPPYRLALAPKNAAFNFMIVDETDTVDIYHAIGETHLPQHVSIETWYIDGLSFLGTVIFRFFVRLA